MTPVKPARGHLGPLTGTALVEMLAHAGLSGTLFLTKGERSALLLIRDGEPPKHTDLGAPYGLGEAGAQYSFWPHSRRDRPSVGVWYPQNQGPLRALPALLEEPLPSTGEINLRALFARLSRTRFSGALVLVNRACQGLFLFQGGVLGAAVVEEPGRIKQGGSALRSALQLAESAALTLHPLPELLSASLLGLALEPQVAPTAANAPTGPPQTGVFVGEAGYTFLRDGEVYLELTISPAGAPGFYAWNPRPPSLSLPTEPPGWEDQRYQLTLRGRDALNPMTELAMRFRSEFGQIGQRALEQFRGVHNTEAAADALGLELSELRSYVERLEAEGFIRRLELR